MPKQTLVFENPVQLSLHNSLLKIAYKENPDEVCFRAIEDIGDEIFKIVSEELK